MIKGVGWKVIAQEGFLSVFNYFQRRPKLENHTKGWRIKNFGAFLEEKSKA